jgi:PAS domain S-box-containing protein
MKTSDINILQSSLNNISIAEQKQAMLAAIIANSDDAIISKTLEGIITSWNPAAQNMFGYNETEAIGQHISFIIPPDRLSEEEIIIGNIAKGNKIDHFETIRMTKDGTRIPISVTVSPITDSSGLIIGASKIVRNISEQLSDREEKARLYEQVKALNEKKDEFIGLASHELRTPLTSISVYLHIISNLVKDEKAGIFITKAVQQVKKLNTLVSDLLDISKIEAGKLPLSAELFDIRQVIIDAIEMVSHGSHNYNITLQTDHAELWITADPNRIEQVIVNLLNNAIRYSPGTDHVNVFLNKENDVIKIGIQDFGIGIAPEKLQHIFSRFYRVDDTNPNISGLGIGLYLCNEIITRHKGKIWAESKPGVGSTFWFTLPIAG